jgi:hypothetical protein
MATKQTNDPVIAHHPSTVAEISQAMAALAEHRRVLRNEGAANCAAITAGSPPARALSDHERRVGVHVQLLMNGSTPASLLVPAVSRDEQIRAELDAIDFVERDLGRRQALAQEREAEQWVVQNATQWRALCHAIVLAAVKLASLEERARDFLEPIRNSHVGGLVMATTIARLSLLGVGDPLLDLRNQALKENVVTNAEIRKAQNVE